MDTRKKIIPATDAGRIPRDLPLIAITAHFDPLHAAHARRLQELSRAGTRVVVIITDPPAPVLAAQARAELAAGLKAVDYVIIPQENSLEDLLTRLSPCEIFREETSDQQRTRELIMHVHRRQSA